MERLPGEQKEQQSGINLLTDPKRAIEAIARIEGPEWFQEQERISREIAETNSDSATIKETANGTIAWALECLRNPNDTRRSGKNICAIRGHVHSYLVYPDGKVCFVIFQAGQDDTHKREELLKTVKELGFEITP